MTCSNYCHQGRQPCPTPYSCGIYSIDSDKPVMQTANSDGSSPDLPVTMEPDGIDWMIWTCKVVAYLVAAAVLFGVAGGYVWKTLFGG